MNQLVNSFANRLGNRQKSGLTINKVVMLCQSAPTLQKKPQTSLQEDTDRLVRKEQWKSRSKNEVRLKIRKIPEGKYQLYIPEIKKKNLCWREMQTYAINESQRLISSLLDISCSQVARFQDYRLCSGSGNLGRWQENEGKDRKRPSICSSKKGFIKPGRSPPWVRTDFQIGGVECMLVAVGAVLLAD